MAIRRVCGPRNAAGGYTIVELLVGVAIIGTVASLLLPAVQAARESARLTTCKNHVSQIAKALIRHEAAMGHFPSGGWSPLWLGVAERPSDPSQPGGWTYGILPYAEEMATHDLVANASPSTAPGVYQKLATTPVRMFSCPSRRSAAAIAVAGAGPFSTAAATGITLTQATRSDYAANGGSVGNCPSMTALAKVSGNVSSTTKITIIHAPPGNPANCQALSLPYPAIVGGHANHPDDRLAPCAGGSLAGSSLLAMTSMTSAAKAPSNNGKGNSSGSRSSADDGEDDDGKDDDKDGEDDDNEGDGRDDGEDDDGEGGDDDDDDNGKLSCASCCSGPLDAVVYSPKSIADGDAWRVAPVSKRLALPDMAVPDMQDGFVHRMSRVTTGHIIDGMSMTYLVGEKFMATDLYRTGTDPGDTAVLFAGYSSSNTRFGTTAPQQDERGVSAPGAFGGPHRAGFTVAFGDGSVRTLPFEIDPAVHKSLSARADGAVVTIPR